MSSDIDVNILKKSSLQIMPSGIETSFNRVVPDKKEFECTLKSTRPPVPKWKFECPKGKAKNFIRENIRWADSLEPTVPCPRQVDSPRGNIQDLSKAPAEMQADRSRIPDFIIKKDAFF